MGKRANIMLFYPFEEKRLATWKPPFICQPKLDGERCRAKLINNNLAVLLSSEGNIITSVPLIQKELTNMVKFLTGPTQLDGELYVHGMSFEDIHSIVGRTVNLSPEHGQMEFHVFDLVDQELDQASRIVKLLKLRTLFGDRVRLVPSTIVWTLDEVRKAFDRFVELGFEGIIVRNYEAPYIPRRSIWGMKFKPKKNDVYPISGFVEGSGKYANTLGALICKTDDFEFEIGSFSLPDDKRQELWEKRFELTNFDCRVAYQHRWSSGKPKSGVFIELVEKTPEVKFQNPLF